MRCRSLNAGAGRSTWAAGNSSGRSIARAAHRTSTRSPSTSFMSSVPTAGSVVAAGGSRRAMSAYAIHIRPMALAAGLVFEGGITMRRIDFLLGTLVALGVWLTVEAWMAVL